jgi:hypothetical protein
MRARIAARQLLHRFVLDADSFLSDLRPVLCSAFQRPHFVDRRRNCVCTNRTAADSAAADLILSHSIRLGAKDARTACVFMQLRIYEISTGENHEISTIDCSNYDADERYDDLVQQRRLLRWWRLLPRRLLHDNDPIIRAV